jgi:hypothetical protein
MSGCSSSQPDPAQRSVNAANRADQAASRAEAAATKSQQSAAQTQVAASRVEQAPMLRLRLIGPRPSRSRPWLAESTVAAIIVTTMRLLKAQPPERRLLPQRHNACWLVAARDPPFTET